jgi:hypothetical protein
VIVGIITYERSTLVNSEKYIGLDVHQATISVAVWKGVPLGDEGQARLSEWFTLTTKFIHLWQNKDGVWKITRVISFDHQALRCGAFIGSGWP